MEYLNTHSDAPQAQTLSTANAPDEPPPVTTPEPHVASLILDSQTISAPEVAQALVDYLTTPEAPPMLLNDLTIS